MTELLTDFEWYRDAKGYRLVPWRSLAPPGENYPPGDCIVANGGKWISYRPFERFATLYSAFASVKTPTDLLNFIKKFGPLTRGGFVAGDGGPEPVSGGATWGDDVSDFLKKARLFRELILRKKSPQALARLFNSELRAVESRSRKEAYERAAQSPDGTIDPDLRWPTIPTDFDIIINARMGARLRLRATPPKTIEIDDRWLTIPVGEFEIVADVQKGVRLRFKTDCLISALWWQLVQKLSGGAMIRECRHCGKLFEVGSGADKRADATFCCDEHSVRFYSLARSRGGIHAMHRPYTTAH
jgi:hypothetical protein